uniref:Uncharacterized protein n=1 Tax=Tanacetum cinerariifolium TaxID=118510 RepID=A0A699JJY9_TANCI|nr:hypothetical protein [Tanacetum cinerariifolium]
MDTESEPFEDPIETEDPQSLPISSAPTISPDYTTTTPHTDKESEPMKVSETRIASPNSITSPSDSTLPLSLDHLLTQTSPTLTPSLAFFYHSTARMAVLPSLTLHSQKRYQGTSKPIEDTEVEETELETKREESKDEGLGSESEEAASKDSQQQLDPTPASPEWSSGSLPVSPASLTVPSPVATPASVEPVDEGFLDELRAEIELHGAYFTTTPNV